MTIEQIKNKLNQKEYDFLRTNENLGKNIIILTLGGSHAYGTNIDTKEYVSDIDIRGVTLESKTSLLGINDSFEQFVDEKN